jgi:hypothetical protein
MEENQVVTKKSTGKIILLVLCLVLGLMFAVAAFIGFKAVDERDAGMELNTKLVMSADSINNLKLKSDSALINTKHMYDNTFNMIMAEYQLVLAVDSYACDSMSRKRLKMALNKIGGSINNIKIKNQ